MSRQRLFSYHRNDWRDHIAQLFNEIQTFIHERSKLIQLRVIMMMSFELCLSLVYIIQDLVNIVNFN